ncbi:P-loop containing nucleoside triphosphate hydrolase protein, partial [Clavulina sp. PMI_390]
MMNLPLQFMVRRLPSVLTHRVDVHVDGPPPSMVLKCDPGAILEWIYPLNHSKRDYQYNIVRKALFDNTLVALPTGLGKTFVAGVIMLNYYRWFPRGKIVFLAPTKPLVAQQIEASHQTCGIPGTDAAELTGMVKDEKRAELWKTKRVFYLTPQTFVNDLRRLPDLASQIVLIVIDEAHRATGAYAYATAVRDMMILNPHHRILALTATPGSTRDAVQAVVDSMHISHIEIRDENALDLREYVHRKHLQQYTVELPQRIAEINNAIIKLMEKLVPGVGQFVPGADMRTMSEYRPLAAMKNLGPGDRWAFGPLSNLSALARAREYLVRASTRSLNRENGKPKHAQKKLAAEPAFKEIMELFRKRKGESTGGMIHPKMDRLRSLLLEYFLNQQEAAADVGEGGSEEARRKESKVMVFASFRNAVEQIVDYLNFDSPLIRAHRFIGQATNKEGRKGLKQKDQLKVVEDFKQGVFNTLVCTSIGEEGLDIGEVDFIVCYDSHKAPIKMLQRIGRTGRKKDGHIAVLVAEGKEETNFAKAKEAYNTVQQNILRGDLIELYTDVPRLLPQTARPEAKEMVMPIIGYVKD